MTLTTKVMAPSQLDPKALELAKFEDDAERIKVRNAWLEDLLDSEGTLPKVSVIVLDGNLRKTDGILPSDVFEGNAGMLCISIPGIEGTIGDVVYGKDAVAPNKLVFTDVSILDEVQGRGYGRRLYLEALKALPVGYGAVCHSMLSPDAEHVWKRLVELGIARLRDGPPSGQLGNYETTF